MDPREEKEERELARLSPYATASRQSRGRRVPEAPCSVRTLFERDVGRLLYSLPFRRLRQKTQVFFNPQSDHVCTRMEHVLYVAYLAETIGDALELNVDLIRAIAYGHDLGHPPFGHAGERSIDRVLKARGAAFRFEHEEHSLRVVDLLTTRNGEPGLNLSFEVRDGIVSHCGEVRNEAAIRPDREKSEVDFVRGRRQRPATLEGCLVRLVDRIAYAGRDIEDARRAGLMQFSDLPVKLQTTLGRTNAQIVNTLVKDVIRQSSDRDQIGLSAEISDSLDQLIALNAEQIYHSSRITRFAEVADIVIAGLFDVFVPLVADRERLQRSTESRHRPLADFVQRHPEREQAEPLRLVTDYVAGMTDHYARHLFDELYLV